MSKDVTLPSNWNNIINLCIQFNNKLDERKQIFEKIINEITILCEENNVNITKQEVIYMMGFFLEISNYNKYSTKFSDIINILTVKNENNQKRLSNIIDLCIKFKSISRKDIFANIVIEFMNLCHEKNVFITKTGAIRMMKSFLEISNNIDSDCEFADLFYILMVADDFKSNDETLKKCK